ncbi:hypothetical protein yc1106_07607 [Curvularia clavata]|uniref:Uncharacterized protein n=1 Tax=Curvularia clavata TaxID=95742 RepID=A0A9Q9DTX8_CURCL|nr:hypothetical protein yc1106_07607 [Curvularia clavata]
MTSLAVAPQTPSLKVRIRSQSFDSPFLRLSVTPVEESPFSKSTGSLKTLPSYDATSDSIPAGGFGSAGALPPLNTKASDASMLSEALSASFSSVTTSPTSSGSSMELDADEALSPSPSQEEEEEEEEQVEQHQHQHQHQRQRPRPHPLAFTQSTTHSDASIAVGPTSPFLYQDTSCPMYSPWLVCAVLDMHDVRRLDWMSIADPIERVWGVRTSSADVLGILSDNGRVVRREWRD